MLWCSPLVNKTILLNTVCVCVGGSKTSAWSRPWDKRGGGGGGHPDPEIRGEGQSQKHFFFRPFEPQFAIKLREGAPPPPGPLPWIRHWNQHFVSRASICRLFGGEKEALPAWIASRWTSQSHFLSSNWFLECEHLFIDKPMVTYPTVLSARVLGLGSKLYPSSMHCMLSKDLRERS